MEYHHESSSLSPTKSTPHSSHTSFPIIAVAIIGILATAFLLVSYYIFVIKCCLNWHRIDLLRRFSFSRRRTGENPPAVRSPVIENRAGLDEAAIRSIPTFEFKKIEDSPERKPHECAVCLNEFQGEEKLRFIPSCRHFFHVDCIDVWLQNNANCPICRTSVSTHTRPDFKIPFEQTVPNRDDIRVRAKDCVVIEMGSGSGHVSDSRGSKEVEGKKLSHVSSMGDECIDSRKKDEQFAVGQPMRRSFSMDSANDAKLCLAVEEIIMQQNRHVISEDCSRGKRSLFFAFGHGSRRYSSSAVQPVFLDP